jgi:hypothetical protein
MTWYASGPTSYGIYKSAGSWSSPNYQQLVLSFDTGIIINGGTLYGHSGTSIQPSGGAVTMGGTLGVTGNATAADFILSSDMRLKTNITPITSALTKLNTITGYTFEFIKDSGKRRSGVLAQEIQDILPEAVYTDADGYLSVSYDAIIPLLIQAIKEQQKKIEELETVITRT